MCRCAHARCGCSVVSIWELDRRSSVATREPCVGPFTVNSSTLVRGSGSRCSRPNMHASENLFCCLVAYRRKDSKVPHPLFRSFLNQSSVGARRKRCTVCGKGGRASEYPWRPIFNDLLYQGFKCSFTASNRLHSPQA